MKKVFIKTVFVLAFSLTALSAFSQGSLSTGADIVSSYVWRGVAQGSNEPNIQPSVSYANNKISIGAWGSGNFSGSLKEFDLYATYAFSSQFSLTLTDYNWTFSKDYFNYKKGTDHIFEAALAYTGAESFPLTASLNTMIGGADKKANGDNAYSTYVELGYPVAPNTKVFCGASLFDSPAVYGTTGFGITNVGIKVNKALTITDKFSLPVYGVVGFNPSASKAFLVAGITL
ncbi:MAG: TorF family putative porin [Bacteroidota bacterium]|nr:TorF family putative porin [Bacteroidota bacterium]